MICDMFNEVDIVFKPLLFKNGSFFSDSMGPGHFLRGQTWFAWNLCSGFPIKGVFLEVVATKTFVQYKPRLNIE